MKKKLCFSVVVLFLSLYSCQKGKDSYSCNPEIDSWVKQNLVGISHMKSAELIVLDPTVQVAVFRAFSANQRLDVWLKRIDQILCLSWTDQERLHILELQKSLNVERFSDEIFIDSEKFQKIMDFEKGWVLIAINNFGWTQNMIGNMFARTDIQLSEKTNLQESNISPSAIDPASCLCSTYDDYCPGSGNCVKDNGCTTTSWGCGLLWGYMCNGKCSLF